MFRSLSPIDRLLVYLSELSSGPWPRFRAAVQASIGANDPGSDRSYFVRVDLEALADIEFSPSQGMAWTIAPTTLVQIPSEYGAAAVVAGARTAALLSELENEPFEKRSQQAGPTQYLVRADTTEELRDIARRLSFVWSPNFSNRLAKMLPATNQIYEAAGDDPAPTGWSMERFENMSWREVNSDSTDGLYRYRHTTTEYRLKSDGRCRKLDRSTAIYEYCRQTGRLIVGYDSSARTLRVPQIAGLPPLAARCATLCSGLLPSSEQQADGRRILCYTNVPDWTGRMIRASLT
jgi:hypothetical protein